MSYFGNMERTKNGNPQSAEIERLKAELRAANAKLSKCGGEMCMGQQLDGVKNWVSRDYHEAEVTRLREAMGKALAFGNGCDCEGCLILLAALGEK